MYARRATDAALTTCATTSRYASTHASSSSANRYPFPTHPRPTPHQIFHLPVGASQAEIKSRYYDLVRVHHPDSPQCRSLSPSLAHARFQSVTAAYDALRGKTRSSDHFAEELRRRRRAQDAYRSYQRSHSYGGAAENPWTATASGDERWKDRMLLFFGLMALGAGLGPMFAWPAYTASYQHHLAASANLAEARREAREYGAERRSEIRRRVREHREKQSREWEEALEAAEVDSQCRPKRQ